MLVGDGGYLDDWICLVSYVRLRCCIKGDLVGEILVIAARFDMIYGASYHRLPSWYCNAVPGFFLLEANYRCVCLTRHIRILSSHEQIMHYRLLRYQTYAAPPVSLPKGVGISANPGLATGCRRYTAAHIF